MLCGVDAALAERGEVAVSLGELTDLRALAANGADSAELARETASLISLLHEARSSNAQVSQVMPFAQSPLAVFAVDFLPLSGVNCRLAAMCTVPTQHKHLTVVSERFACTVSLFLADHSLHVMWTKDLQQHVIHAPAATEGKRQVAVQAESVQEDTLQ